MSARTSLNSLLIVLIAGICLVVFRASPALAMDMEKMSEAEMEDVSAGSFSKFTVEEDQARMFLNIHTEVWAEADSFRAGYHDDGWDQNWQNVQMGQQDDYMQMKGFVMQAQFDDIDSDNRRLQTYEMGFESVTGTLDAEDFDSFSGTVSSGQYRRTGDVQGITFEEDPFKMVIDTGEKYNQPGIYMDFGDAEAEGVE